MSVRACVLILFIALKLPAAGFLTAGYAHGGDSLSHASGGHDYSTQAGSGLYFVGGIIFPISATTPHRFEAQCGLGYLFQNDEHSREDSVSWSRVPFEAIYYYHNTRERFRLGFGTTYHVSNRISGKGANAGAQSSADNAWGRILTIEKLWQSETGETLSIGLRHTAIHYHLTAFDTVVNGDAWSVTLTGFLF